VDKPLVIDQMRLIITEVFRNWKQLPFQVCQKKNGIERLYV